MNNNITLGVAGLALALGIYNTTQVSSLDTKIENKVFTTPLTPVVNSNGVQKINPIEVNNKAPQSNTQEVKGPSTSIKFGKEIHDFGTLDINTDNPYSFVFTNTGKEPLLITNARGSCGCTVPSWPKDPIMPGQTGKIDVVYRPSKGQAGKPQEKTVTITANTEPTNTIVRIKANINPVAE